LGKPPAVVLVVVSKGSVEKRREVTNDPALKKFDTKSELELNNKSEEEGDCGESGGSVSVARKNENSGGGEEGREMGSFPVAGFFSEMLLFLSFCSYELSSSDSSVCVGGGRGLVRRFCTY
jgi:hypothetical protein